MNFVCHYSAVHPYSISMTVTERKKKKNTKKTHNPNPTQYLYIHYDSEADFRNYMDKILSCSIKNIIKLYFDKVSTKTTELIT